MDEPRDEPGLPAYIDRAAFTESEVRVGPEGDALDGTLSVPIGEGPFPAVVLVHGSGPHDRDETIGAQRPFRDLAYGLSSVGVAVLRYEKRSRQRPASLMGYGNRLTVKEETIDDAVRAVQAARGDARVDPGRVFVLGHSLGANVAPRIAQAASDVAGIIVMAGNARPLEDLIVEQFNYLLPLQAPPEVVAAQLEALGPKVALVKSAELALDTPAAALPLGIPAGYWLDLRAHDPLALARSLGKPILVLQGGRDYQVTVADFELWKAALEGGSFASCVLFPELNHLFAAGSGKSRPEEYMVPGHVAAEVIEVIAAFVKRA